MQPLVFSLCNKRITLEIRVVRVSMSRLIGQLNGMIDFICQKEDCLFTFRVQVV